MAHTFLNMDAEQEAAIKEALTWCPPLKRDITIQITHRNSGGYTGIELIPSLYGSDIQIIFLHEYGHVWDYHWMDWHMQNQVLEHINRTAWRDDSQGYNLEPAEQWAGAFARHVGAGHIDVHVQYSYGDNIPLSLVDSIIQSVAHQGEDPGGSTFPPISEMGTPNINAVIDHMEAQSYSDWIDHYGVWNCRSIAGSSTWSQHAWGNAVDIMLPLWFRKSRGDIIVADLRATYGWQIRTILWQVKDHYDHIHVDLWPRGWSLPPCAGGTNTIMYDDGSIVQGPFPLDIVKEDDLALLTDEQQLLLARFLDNLAAMGSSVDFTNPLIPDIRKGIVTQDELPPNSGFTIQEVIDAIISRLEN